MDMKELKSINDTYVKVKAKADALTADVKRLKKDLASARAAVTSKTTILEGKREELKIETDATKRAQLDADIKVLESEVKAAKQNVLKIREESHEKRVMAEHYQGEVEKNIDFLRQDPEVQAHINRVVGVKSQRAAKKAEKERDELVSKKEKLTSIQEMMEKHPTLRNNISGMLTAKRMIEDANNKKAAKANEQKEVQSKIAEKTAEMKKLIAMKNPTQDVINKKAALSNEIKGLQGKEAAITAEITALDGNVASAQSKFAMNRTSALGIINKENPEIGESGLDGVVADIDTVKPAMKYEIKRDPATGKAIVNPANGKPVKEPVYDLKSTMDRLGKKYDKQIVGKEKSMHDYGMAVQGADAVEYGMNDQAIEEQAAAIDEKYQQKVEKLKWYQFVKRFKAWREHKKEIIALPEPDEFMGGESAEDNFKNNKNEQSEFRASLKYDIVKDMVKDQQQADLQGAKQQRREKADDGDMEL